VALAQPARKTRVTATPIILNGTCLSNGKPARTGTVCGWLLMCARLRDCDGISTACPSTSSWLPRSLSPRRRLRCGGVLPDPRGGPDAQLLAKRPCVASGDRRRKSLNTAMAPPCCPTDAFAPATTQCRGSADGNVCDPAESVPAPATRARPTRSTPDPAAARGCRCPAPCKPTCPGPPSPGTPAPESRATTSRISSISTGLSTPGRPRPPPLREPHHRRPALLLRRFGLRWLAHMRICQFLPAVSAQSCSPCSHGADPHPGQRRELTLTWTLVSARRLTTSRAARPRRPIHGCVNAFRPQATKTVRRPSNGSATFYYVVGPTPGTAIRLFS